jgi:hypothetical protein
MQFIKRVLTDIKKRQNIEIYAIGFGAFVVAIASLFGDAILANLGDNVVNSMMLAALGLLVLAISTPQKDKSALDDYLDDRSNLGAFADRLQGARKLYIYAPSAANILHGDNAEVIRREIISKKDGDLRVIIQNPDKEAAVDILVDQLDRSLEFQVQHLPEELQRTIRQFKLIHSWDLPGHTELKMLDYSPGFSMVMIDPDRNNGQIIVEVHGYQNESTRSRMHIVITKKESERWFVYWQHQFETMWSRGETVTFSPDDLASI